MLVLGDGEAELFRAQRRAGGAFPLAQCHSRAWHRCPVLHSPGWDPEGLCCPRLARLALCPRPELAQALSPRRCRGHALRGEVTALALPGRTSLLSRVCPSWALSGDFNRLWGICCSRYPIVFAHRGSRNGNNSAAGPGGCGSQSTRGSRVQRFLWVTGVEIAQGAAFCIYPSATLDLCWILDAGSGLAPCRGRRVFLSPRLVLGSVSCSVTGVRQNC